MHLEYRKNDQNIVSENNFDKIKNKTEKRLMKVTYH